MRPSGEDRFRETVRIAGKSDPKRRPKVQSTGVVKDGKLGGLPAEYWENDAGRNPDHKPAPHSEEDQAKSAALAQRIKKAQKADD